jgi:hypothetical protein
MNFDSNAGGKIVPRPRFAGKRKLGEDLVDCAYFSTFKFELGERMYLKMPSSDEFRLWVFLEGHGRIGWTSAPRSMLGVSYAGEFSYKQGECWFLPAEFCSHSFYPDQKTSVLMTSPKPHAE